jgi:hypothetical protein
MASNPNSSQINRPLTVLAFLEQQSILKSPKTAVQDVAINNPSERLEAIADVAKSLNRCRRKAVISVPIQKQEYLK